jgi:2-methylisocitrate lyase-like PEP mutase family enzyme
VTANRLINAIEKRQLRQGPSPFNVCHVLNLLRIGFEAIFCNSAAMAKSECRRGLGIA